MDINLKNTEFYFLTTKQKTDPKYKHIINILQNHNVTPINAILNIGKQKSGSMGHYSMIEHGLQNQDIKTFKPFIILEDDVSLYSELPSCITVPKDADIIYVGISAAGLKNNDWKPGNRLYATDTNHNCVKIYNMLSTHAILICSLEGANIYKRCMIQNYATNGIAWDVPLAKMQPTYNIYALKTPLFYQDKKWGGCEHATKIRLKDGNIIYDTNRNNGFNLKYYQQSIL